MKQALVIGTLIAAMVSLTSCYKTPEPGTAEVKVVDENGVVQKKVDVTLYCTESDCVVRKSGKTNELGVYAAAFDLPVVLRVRCVRYDTTTETTGLAPFQVEKVTIDSVCGEGFVQIENDEIANETITILECN